MRRTLLIAAALLASHGAALWLGRNSPVSGPIAAAATPESPATAAVKKPGAELAGFLRRAAQAEQAANPAEEEEEDEDALLSAAKAAIPADADLAAMVKAGADPDLEVSTEIRAAFGLWMERDPVAALHWLSGWMRDASDYTLRNDASSHLEKLALEEMGRCLREVPAARDFLLMEDLLGRADLEEPEAALRWIASFPSQEERLSYLDRHFSLENLRGLLPQVRALLDDRGAAKFLGQIEAWIPSAELLAEVEAAGFPPHAVAQFLADHPVRPAGGLGADLAGLGMGSRSNADFIGIVTNTQIPGVPAATGTNVTDIVTNGLRGGDGPINRNNIDAILNNPNRSSKLSHADEVRGIFSSSVSWLGFSEWVLQGVPGYAENREDFLRGKITGEEWVTRLQGEIPGGGDLQDELMALAFRVTVEEDPRRAVGLLEATNPHRDLIMDLPQVTPETLVAMTGRLSGDEGLQGEVKNRLWERMKDWAEADPEAWTAFMAELPAGPVNDFLHPPADEDRNEGKEGE